MDGRKRFVICLLLGWMAHVQAAAQQMPQFSQYMTNSLIINPAVAGIENYMDIRTSFRKQWVGLEGSPTTLYTSAHASIGKVDRNAQGRGKFKQRDQGVGRKVDRNNKFHRVSPHHGVGGMVQVDQAGLLRTTSVNLIYSFHLPLTNTVNLASGISVGSVRNSFNTGEARVVNQSDAALFTDQVNVTKADVRLGVWLYTPNAYLGLSSTQLINTGSDFKSALDDVTIVGRLVPHYFATAGYRVRFHDFAITPSILYKKAGPSYGTFDLNVKAMYNERIWLGASFRTQDAVSAMFGLYVSPVLDFGYSYDLTTSEQYHTSAGSHEIIVGIKVNNKLKALCPQWVW